MVKEHNFNLLGIKNKMGKLKSVTFYFYNL